MNTGNGALAAAVDWIELLLLGQVGTSITVLAVAGIGLALLQGRFAVRSGIRVVIACFILFGAPAISQALVSLARLSIPVIDVPPPAPPAPPIAPPSPPPKRDPYASAAVPMQ